MATRRRTAAEADPVQSTMYNVEHWGAWVAGLGGAAMAVIGLLVGFDIIAWEGLGAAGEGATGGANFWEGLVWIVGGISLYTLSAALHQTQHHYGGAMETDKVNKGIMGTEHTMAWVAALAALVMGAIGLLVAYETFGMTDNPVFDGLLWMFASFGAAIFALGLHSVQHHQPAADEEYILAVVERSSARTTTAPGTAAQREPGTEPRP